MKLKFLLSPVLGLLVLWLAGCAGNPAKTPEQALVERAHAYWDAAKLHDAATVYRLESGSLDGKLTPDAAQSMVLNSSLLSYNFKHIQIHDKEAEIEVEAKLSLPQLHTPFTNRTTQHWILIDGEWYHLTSTPPIGALE
jgi:hypothetical protein